MGMFIDVFPIGYLNDQDDGVKIFWGNGFVFPVFMFPPAT